MFEQARQSFREMLAGRLAPDDRRAIIQQMKGTLVQARVGLEELRDGMTHTKSRIENERRELETVHRRRGLAEKISDAETVAVAARYEAQLVEKVRVLEQKLAAQEAELAMLESEVADMTAEFRKVAVGPDMPAVSPTDAAAAEVDAALDTGAGLKSELDALGRAQSRAQREAEADERLAALKRRMGK